MASGGESASGPRISSPIGRRSIASASDFEPGSRSEVSSIVDEIGNSLPIPAIPLTAETAENAILGHINAGSDDEDEDDEERPSETAPLLRRDEEPLSAAVSTTKFLSETNPRRFWICFSVIQVNLFVASFDGTIMATSYPVITSEFNAANSATWLSTSFLLTSTTFQPLMGRVADAIGRKPLFVGCSLVFLISLVWCALAPTLESFIVARALSGIGCGGAAMMGAIMTSDMVPIEHRGTYQALTNIVFGSGGALGAALGGLMAETLGWRWEFGVQVPLVFLVTVIAVVAIPSGIGVHHELTIRNARRALKGFDIKGSILLTVSLACLILGINIGGNNLPWSHPFIITMLVVCVVTFPVFIFSQKKAAKPVMPLAPLRTAPRANIIFANFLVALVYSCVLFNMPLYFQAVLLSNATSSGLRLILPTIASSATGALTGHLITRTRNLKWPLTAGSIVFFLGCLCLSLLRSDLPDPVFIAVIVPSSVSQGFLMPGNFMALLATTPHRDQAVITSTLVLWRSLGLVLGVAYSGLVVQNGLRYYLRLYIDAPDKEDIIDRVRRSVELVARLEEPLRSQVTASYEASIKISFYICAVLAAIVGALLLPIKLPRLPERK